jgi:dienelactone hydrolase
MLMTGNKVELGGVRAGERTMFRPRKGRKVLLAFLTATTLLGAVLIVSRGIWAANASIVMYGMLNGNRLPMPVRAYLWLRDAGSAARSSSIPSADLTGARRIPVRIYTPAHVAHPRVIVLIHGFAPDGYRNDYLDLLATRLAWVGFKVVVPNIASEQYLESREQSVSDIGETVKWSARQAHGRVSLFGISFGGGLAVATAEEPTYARDVDMVFDLSGYDSLQRVARYYIHDKVTGPDGVPYPSDPPLAGSLLVSYQHLDEIVPADQVPGLRRAILLLIAGRSHPDWDAAEAPLTRAERLSLSHLLQFDSPQVHAMYVRLIKAHGKEDSAISPDGKFDQLQCPIYVLHGSADSSIPAGEAEWVRHEIPASVEAHFLISPEMSHAFLNPSSTRWQKLDVVFFVADALETAAHSS